MRKAWTTCVLGLGVVFGTCVAALAEEQARNAPSTTHMTKVHRANEAIGLTVKNNADESLGKIADLLLTPDGKCHFAIIGHGGTLGIGEDFIPVPIKALHCDEANKVARLDMTKAKFETAPKFKKVNYYQRWTPEWCTSAHEFFGIQEPAKKKDAGDPFYASQLLKANVEDHQSTKIAQLTDIAFDDDCQARFAIMSHGGLLKIGDKEIAVPWAAFKLRRGEKTSMFVVMNMSKEQLERAPVLTRDKYADLLDPAFVDSTHRFFAVERREVETENRRNK